MSESQFAEALRTALDEETAGMTAHPDAARLARRHGRRGKATRGLMTVVPAVALIAGGAAVAAHGTGTASPAATHPAVLTAAYVTKKVEATLSSDNYIVETTGNGLVSLHSTSSSITPTLNALSSGMPVTTWTDPVTGTSRW